MTVQTETNGGDPHGQEVLERGFTFRGSVSVRINEPRRHEHAARIDHLIEGHVHIQVFWNGVNQTSMNDDMALQGRRARSIDQRSSADQEIEPLGFPFLAGCPTRHQARGKSEQDEGERETRHPHLHLVKGSYQDKEMGLK